MRIGMLLDPYGEKSPGGLGRSTFETAKAILAADTSDSFVIYVKRRPPHRPAFAGGHWSLVPLESRALWLTGGLRMDRGLDLYIFFTPLIPLFFRPKRSIVVALDFAYLDVASTWKEKLRAALLYRLHRRSLKLATRVAAISEDTKRVVAERFGIPESRITVVYPAGVGLGVVPAPIAAPERFFLFAGVLKARKNVANIIRAFAEFKKSDEKEHRLLIAGKTGGAYYDMLKRLATGLGIGNAVAFVGYVSDAELAYLYSKARALVFPSFIEGFGMPVLEAMSARLPVITSHRGALAEVAGGAAFLVDPHDPRDIARGMRAMADDDSLRAQVVEKGKRRAAEFSWDRTAEGYMRLIVDLRARP